MIDLNTSLRVQISGRSKRYRSFLVGKETDHYLIIKTPSIDNWKTLFAKDTELVVRYVHQGSVYGFKSKIIFTIPPPLRVSFIRFPDRVEDFNLRTFKRFECHLPTRLQVMTRHHNRQLIFRSTIFDISKGGCKVLISRTELEWVNELVKINAKVELFASLPGLQEELKFSGTVRNVTQDSDGLSLGIQFAELENRAETELQKFLAVTQK